MRTAISILIGLLLMPTVAAAVTRKPSMSQQDLVQRWQQYMSNPGSVESAHDFPYKKCFSESAAKYQLPESLLLALARGESNFDPKARSSANAYGLMQILWPSTAKDLGIDSLQQLLDPCLNVDAGAHYIRQLLDRYQGNMHKAVAAYNYGPGRIPLEEVNIPTGAAWYSDYILRHLDYVQQQTDRQGTLVAMGQMLIIAFDRPYRASAFVNRMQPGFGDLRLDYFRREDGRFHVLMQYNSDKQKQAGRQKLRELGFQP
jgi:hypothetical protein